MFARVIGALSLATYLVGVGAAFAAADNEPMYFSAAQLKELTAKTQDGLVSSRLPVGKEAIASATRRDADGQVELHMKQHDLLIFQGGKATELVGGKIDGNHQTAPDEFRGGKITGAKSYPLSPGDVLWIPAGTPHQMVVEKGGSINYIGLKFDAQPK